jgi:hypothetical protein
MAQFKKIEGLYFKYVGNNWKTSPEDEWEMVFVDESERVRATKLGTRKLFRDIARVYSCNECPHTFYAD